MPQPTTVDFNDLRDIPQFLAHTYFMNVISRILLCLCALTGASHAQETFFRNIYDVKTGSYVEVVSLFAKLPTTGYAPVRVTVANRTSVPAIVSLSFESAARGGAYRSGEQKMKSSFSAGSPAGTVTSTDLLVPVAAMVKDTTYSYGSASHSLSLTMGGVSNGSYTQSNGVSRSFPNLLLSEALSTPNASALDSAAGSKASSYSYSNISFGGKFTPSMMPEDWRAYAGYDGMLLTEKDWLDLSPGARSAVLQWNRLGGYLRIYSSNSSTTLNTLGIDDRSSRILQRGKGTVLLASIKSDLSLDATFTVNDMTTAKGVDTQAHTLIDDYSSTSWNLQSELGIKTFHFVMFILVLIAFGILVGPVNLFVFAKSGKRHKLFITTPIISIGASFAMILLIFLQDGLGGKGIRVQWMEITQENGDNNAYIHQEQISRSGVLIGNRFTLTEPTVITPLPLAASQWTRLNSDSNADQSYEVNFVNKGLLVTGDWFQSRSEQAQLLQAVIPTRARIESRPGGNEAALLSNFDYPLAALYFRGSGNKFWKAQQIAAGKNFLCTECTEADYNDFVNQSVKRLGKSQQEKVKQLAKREGHYIATTSDAPMQDTYSSIRWKESHTIITGRVQNPEAP